MKWQVKQKIKRIAALLLSFVLLFDALEISAPAPIVRAMERDFSAFCAVTAFAELPQELREQTLPIGAQESEIELPGSLSVTANVLEALPKDTAPAQTESAAQGGAPLVWNDEIPEEEEILDADAEPQTPQTPAQPQAAPALTAQDGVSLTVDGMEEIPQVQNTVKLDGVQWRIDAARSAADTFLADEEHAGMSYIYVAVLPEKDSAGNTVVLQKGAELPEMHVSVEGEQDAEAEASGEKQSEIEALTGAESETEKETETETIAEKNTKTEIETEIETEEETDAEQETGSDLAVEKETGKETETEELTEAETETEEISETESEIETEIEDEIEEQEVSLMSLAGEGGVALINGNTVDLTPYITDVDFTWTDKNGIQWPITPKADGSYEFPADHTLGFTLNYFMPKGTVTRERNVVTYKLPAGFEYTDITDGKIAWGNGTAGTYTIKGGVVTLTFDPNSEFFATDTDFTGYVTFDSKLKADSTGASGSLEFKEDVKFTYTITEKKEEGTSTDSSFSADKSCTEFEGSKLNYKIVVKPGASGATNVTLKDKLSVSANNQTLTGFTFDDINVSDGTKTLTRLNDNLSTYTEGETVTTGPDDKGQTVTTVSYKAGDTIVYKKVITKNADGTASELIVPEDGYYAVEQLPDGTYVFRLPDMESTEQYTITYSADLAEVFDDKGIDPNWDTYSVSNSVDDSHDTYKDTDWQNHTSSWIKKSSTGAATLNSKGEYEAGWKIEINPDHQALPLDTEFSDKLVLPAGITWENGALNITVTHKDGTSETYTNLSELLSFFGDGTKMKIGELLAKLGIINSGDVSTTDDTITIEYTTTVPKSALPNGTTTATNTSTLTEGGHNSSSSASTGMENDILTKEADSENVRIENVTYSENAESKTEQMILIPWEASVTMEGNIGAEGDNTEVTASITDTFGEHLWVTQEYLKENLAITMPDRTLLNSPKDYTLLYTTDRENHNYEEKVSEGSKVTGFKVVFNSSVYDTIKGQKLALKYTLYGDADFMRQNQTEWLGPQRTFVNTIQYGENTVNAEYTKDGDYFVKELLVNYTEYKQDNEIDWDSLQEGRLVWRAIAQLASTSVGKDIVITDTFPAGLDLYSVSVERNYGFSGKTEPLISFEAGSYTLRFSYNDGNGDETADIEITIKELEDGRKEITAKIPGSVVKEGNKSYFDLRVEATVPEGSALLDPKDLKVQEKKFTNHASLQVGGEPSNEDDHTVTVKKDKPVLKKDGFYTASEDGPRIMHYVLKANPDGAKRLNGKMLTLEDTLTYEPDIVGEGGTVQKEAKVVSLVPGSVKAYFYDESGQEVYLPAKGKDFSYKYEEIDCSETEGVTAGKRQNKLTMYIPDALAVYIEYDYELQSNQKKIEWQIDNEAVLIGSDQWKSKDEQKVEYESSTAGVTKNFVNFYKVDEDNYNITLPDAEFALYQWKGDADSGDWVEWKDASGNTEFVSDSKGHLPIEGLKSGILYWLKETNPPLGYQISDQYGQKVRSSEPADDAGYYFYLVDAMSTPVIPTDFDEERIHELSGANTVYIPNKSTGAIAARKVWADGTTPVDIWLTLYQGDGAGYTYQDTVPAAGEGEAKLKPVTDAEGNALTKKIEAGATGDKLTVTWDNLDKEDGSGNLIYYYVFETKAGEDGTPVILEDGSYMIDGYNVEYSNNFGITAGTVTITNSKPSISVEKVWADEKENDHSGDSVNVELYQSFMPPEKKEESEESKTKTIRFYVHSEDQETKNYWNDSEKKVYEGKTYVLCKVDNAYYSQIKSDRIAVTWNWNGNTEVDDSISLVCDKEVQMISGRLVDNGNSSYHHYSKDWEMSGITDSCDFYVSVDASLENYAGEFTVTELDSMDSELQLPDAEPVTLPEGQAKVTLNKENDWKYEWNNLPLTAKDSSGKDRRLYYYVKETNVEGYNPKYSYEYNEDGSLKLVTVTNRPDDSKYTNVTVKKKWLNSDDDEMTPGLDWNWKVTLQLYQKQGDEWIEYPENGMVTLPEDGLWWHTWDGLPKGEYYVAETKGQDGFEVTYESNSASAGDADKVTVDHGTITVVNKEVRTGIKVQKRWQDAEGKDISSSSGLPQVQMQLYQSAEPPAEIKETNPGTQTGEGKKVTLKVYGTEVASELITEDSALVRIAYGQNYDDGKNCESLKFAELQYEPKNIIVRKKQEELVKNEGDAYNYLEYIVDLSELPRDEECELTFINESSSGSTYPEGNPAKGVHQILPYSEPSDPGTTTPDDGDENKGKLILPDDKEPYGEPVTLNNGSIGWQYEWTALPQYDAKGNKLYYYVDELNKDQYDPKYTYEYIDPDAPWKGIKLVTVTNTLPDTPPSKKTSVKVTKEWKNSDGEALDTEVSNYQVKVQLQWREKGKTPEDEWKDYQEPVIITKEDDKWTHTWSDLEWIEYVSVGVVSREYEYRVQEVEVYDGSPGDGAKVDNFEPTYSDPEYVNGGFEFTITNTKKRQGITLPGTGSKYPWIFYGIGMTFMLIALVWMRRALKKSYIPSDTGKGGRRSDE